MKKVVRLTESELVEVVKKMILNNNVISEVNKIENFDDDFPEYKYSSIGVVPSRLNPDMIGAVYFNGVVFGRSDYHIPEYRTLVSFNGSLGEFEFDSEIIKFNGKSPYVMGKNLNDIYYNKFYQLMTLKSNGKSSNDLSSQDIRDALKNAFREYWVEETPEFTSGLRNIESIGDYLKNEIDYSGDTTETWSLMNFFDTRNIPKLINKKWKEEGYGDKVEWLENIFKNDKKFLKKLLDTQWRSVYSGFYVTEPSAIKKLKKMFKDEKLDATFETYRMGHIKDRKSGVDVEFKIKGDKRSRGIQIKPSSKIEYLNNGELKVFTNNMKNSYKNRNLYPKLDYILYDMGNTFYLFRNSDYVVLPNTEGRQVIHSKPPAKVFND